MIIATFDLAHFFFISVPSQADTMSQSEPMMKSPGIPEEPIHSFLAGAIGGYFVWGRYSSVNYQIVLYLTSRILVGLWKRQFEHARQKEGHDKRAISVAMLDRTTALYPIAAATVWGIVMYLFETHPDVLHPSLKSSMDEIYRVSYRPTNQTSNQTKV